MYPNLNTGAIGVKATLPEQIDLAKRHGFGGIDFSIVEAQRWAAAQDVATVKAWFDDAGVRPGSFGFAVEYRKDEATWRQGLAQLPAQVKLARDLGCDRSTTWLLPCDNDRDLRANFRFHVERLRPAALIMADYGIRFGLEFIGPKTLRVSRTHRFLYTLEGMLALAAAIDTGNVGLLLDLWHLYTAHGSNDQVLELTNSDVVVVHVNDAPAGIPIDEQVDNVRALPGETGVMDIAGFMAALKTIGYDGPVTAEPFSQRVRDLPAEEAVVVTAASMQKIWPRR